MKRRRRIRTGTVQPRKTRLGRAWGRPRGARQTAGFAWYSEEEWQRLRELADDVEALDATYADWLSSAERAIADLRSIGVMAVKVPVDVSQAAGWCERQSRRFDSAGRAAYVTDLLRTSR